MQNSAVKQEASAQLINSQEPGVAGDKWGKQEPGVVGVKWNETERGFMTQDVKELLGRAKLVEQDMKDWARVGGRTRAWLKKELVEVRVTIDVLGYALEKLRRIAI